MGNRLGEDIAERLLEFAAGVARVIGALPRDVYSRHIGLQILRSSTSGGANYEEARLIQRLALIPGQLEPLLREADELTAILVASARTARSR